MAKLASLIVDLQLESAQMRHGLAEANRKLDEFAKQSEKAGNILAGAISFDVLRDGLVSLAAFVKGGADMADAMGDLSAAVGVPVEDLSKLAYAAQFSGSSTEAVGKALAKTADLMGKALAPTSEQAAMFKALGISVTDADGKLRATQDVFADIAQRFSETSDGAGKTALAVKLFGDEGTKLIPLLNEGKAGLAKFGEEAARTGNVITEKGAAGAAQFNDALDRLKKAGEGLAARVAQDLAPSVAGLAENFTTSKAGAESFDTAAVALAGTLRVLASAGVIVGATFQAVAQDAAGIASVIADVVSGDLDGAKESAQAAGRELRATFDEAGKRLAAVWDKAGPGAAMAKDAEKAKPAADEYVSAMDRAKKAAERAAEAQKKLSEEARKAAENSAKALDEYVKGALALERQQAAIDRAVEKRRAAGDGASPTAGFADLDDALARLAAAQKAALVMRDRAGTREKEGDLIGADRALRKAEDLDALAERAASAADAFADGIRKAGEEASKAIEEEAAARIAVEEESRKALAEALARVPEDLLGMLKPSGPATSALAQGVQTGMAAGPVGAVVGGLVGLLSQSETFQNALESLEAIFQTLANSIGLLVEPLLPLLTVVAEVAAGLGALIQALSPLIEFVARPLFEVLKGFGLVVLGLVKFIGELVNSIAQLFGGEGFDLSGIGEAMERLEKASYDSAREQQKVADAARATSEGMANVPAWWKVELGRVNAADPGSGPGGSGGGTTTITDNSKVEINVVGVTDATKVAEIVMEKIEEAEERETGSRYGKLYIP